MLRAFVRVVFAWQRRRARMLGVTDGKTGAVTFVQRFGSFTNLNTHFHSLIPAGVFAADGKGPPAFVALAPPTDDEVAALTLQIIGRVVKILARYQENAGDEDDLADALAAAQAASVQSTDLLTRAHRSRAPDTPAPRRPRPTKPTRAASVDGFSLHAGTFVHQNDRLALERLLRYGGRPAISADRLSLTDDGRVCYRFRKPAPSGKTAWVGSPEDFLARLATLIPPPRQHTIRYHGVFAANAALRRAIVPPAPASAAAHLPATDLPTCGQPSAVLADPRPPDATTEPASCLVRRLDWAALLQRVFAIDVSTCPRCQGRLDVVAFITDEDVIARILAHLHLPRDPIVIAPARAPPQLDFDSCFDSP